MTNGATPANRGQTNPAREGDDLVAAPGSRDALRAVKCLISLGFWCLSETGRLLLRLLGRHPAPIATVLYYHQIRPFERQRFARQLDHLRKWAKPIHADPDESLSPGRYVAVTFDDGWQSFAENALPELEKRNIPVTLFAIVGRLGHRLEQHVDEMLISEAQLQQLSARGVTIGSHTLTHCRLTAVDEARALYELRESRRMLAELVDHEVALFSFPFSQSNETLVALCREAGYRRVFNGLPCLAYSRSGEFETGRVRADPGDWLIEFHLKIMGAYRWLPAGFALKRRLRWGMKCLVEQIRPVTAIFLP